jgi:predicted SAM-dependent methyltransferase
MNKINPLVAIGIPTWGTVSMSWAQSYKRIGGPLGANMLEMAPIIGKPIAEARNELMAEAIANKADFLFMLGDDVLAPPDTVIRLLQRLWDNPEIAMVSGVYWTKQWPTSPYIWRGIQRGPYLDWKYGEFFEVDYAGCDCLLIRLTPEMKELGPEWFSTNWTWEDTDPVPLLATEDFYFYTKTRKAGMKLWCDTQVQCVHEDRQSRQQYALTTEMPQYTGRPDAPLPAAETDDAPLVKIAELGCGLEQPYFGRPDRCKVYRFDGNETLKPDYRCDLRKLPVSDESFDMVHSRHVLEHFGRSEVMSVMREWARILRVGGEFRLCVPNIMSAMRKIIFMEEGIGPIDRYPFWQLYGEQKDHYDFHKNGFTPRRIALLMESLGCFEDIEVKTSGTEEEDDLNIEAVARKARHLGGTALLKEWDEIELAEGIVMPGRKNDDRSALAETGEGDGSGVRAAGAPALGAGAEAREEAAGGAETPFSANGQAEPEVQLA